MGVACELFDSDSELDCRRYLYRNGASATATPRVVDALGLYTNNGWREDGRRSLVRINDTNDSFKPVIEAIQTGDYYRELDD